MNDPFSPAPQMGGAPADFASSIPDQYRSRVDPNNPVQKILFDRVGALQPADLQALDQIPDAAVAVLKKLLPEVDFMLDQITRDADMQQGGMPPVPPGGQPQPAPGGMPRPVSRLGGAL